MASGQRRRAEAAVFVGHECVYVLSFRERVDSDRGVAGRFGFLAEVQPSADGQRPIFSFAAGQQGALRLVHGSQRVAKIIDRLADLPTAHAERADGENEDDEDNCKSGAEHDFVSLLNPPQAAANRCDVAELLVSEFSSFVGCATGELQIARGKGQVIAELVGDVGVEVDRWGQLCGKLGGMRCRCILRRS
jgi:hypothetical protein